MAKQFLIMGCHRTGTTLLKFIMEAHPDIYCHGEASAYEAFLGLTKWAIREPLIGYQLSGLIEQVPLITAKKLPILATRRNVYDTVSSLASLAIPNGTMLKDYIAPWAEKRLASDEFFVYMMEKEIHILRAANESVYLAAIGALHYKWVSYLFGCYITLGYPVLIVQYEHLVTETESVCRAICAFLGVDWSPLMLKHYETIHSDLADGNLTLGGNDASAPVHQFSIDKALRTLTAGERDIIARIMED